MPVPRVSYCWAASAAPNFLLEHGADSAGPAHRDVQRWPCAPYSRLHAFGEYAAQDGFDGVEPNPAT